MPDLETKEAHLKEREKNAFRWLDENLKSADDVEYFKNYIKIIFPDYETTPCFSDIKTQYEKLLFPKQIKDSHDEQFSDVIRHDYLPYLCRALFPENELHQAALFCECMQKSTPEFEYVGFLNVGKTFVSTLDVTAKKYIEKNLKLYPDHFDYITGKSEKETNYTDRFKQSASQVTWTADLEKTPTSVQHAVPLGRDRSWSL